MNERVIAMKREMLDVLTKNILPFWLDKMQDHEHGGFYGRIDGRGHLHPEAEKGAILNARILWAFSAAYRVLKDLENLEHLDHLEHLESLDYSPPHHPGRPSQGRGYHSSPS